MAQVEVGIPYAKAVVDAKGYGVECPACGLVSRDVDEGQETAEDAETKGASTRHALHWEATHATWVRCHIHGYESPGMDCNPN